MTNLIKSIQFISNHPKWQFDMKEARILSQNGKSQTAYLIFDLPWPLMDRDAIQMSTEEKTKLTYRWTSLSTTNEFVPLNPKYLRASQSGSLWDLKEVENGVEVTLFFWFKPTKVPIWILKIALPGRQKRLYKNLLAFANNYSSKTNTSVKN
ncbi:MAG: hypothetical protein MPK62_13280 [Alphaproteobacteria bacterium]|nr:hypothetical protein [Alphaproteobacteria bacterium]